MIRGSFWGGEGGGLDPRGSVIRGLPTAHRNFGMIPMGVKDNHTKFEQETQRWWLRTGVTCGELGFPNVSKNVKNVALAALVVGFFSEMHLCCSQVANVDRVRWKCERKKL